MRPTINPAQANAAADSCEKELKIHYKSTGSYVQLLPWVDDDKRHIMDIYTTLWLAKDHKVICTHKTIGDTLQSYEDIFFLETKGGELIRLAVLNGLPGRGKSTLFDKMSFDWADDASDAVQKKYKLVILLKMHALEQSSDLIDATFEQLLAEDTAVGKRDLESYVKTNSGKILILLDGFDEFMTTSLSKSSFGSILKILNRKVCRGCSVLVSTRPSHFDRLVTKDLIQNPFTHVKVLGFNGITIREYVYKFFSESDDEHDTESHSESDDMESSHCECDECYKAKGLLKRIESSAALFKLAESPMLLLLMCLLWRKDATLRETMSCLYSDAIEYIFNRKADTCPRMSPGEISDIVIKIGKTGLRGLLSPDQVLSFKEEDFEENALDAAMKAGILTRQRVLKGLRTHNSVQFIHKTFQEFCAATYLQSLFVADIQAFQKTLDDIISKDPESFGYLLRFCCGDNEACTSMILKAFQEKCHEDLSGSLGVLAVHCYFEGQSECLPAKELVYSIFTEDYIYIANDDYLNSITYFLKHVVSQTEDRGNAYLANVKEMDVSDCDLGLCGEDLAYSMKGMTNLHSLLLCNCLMSSEVMKHIAESLRDLPNMVELGLPCNSHLGGTASLWSKHLTQLQRLQKLNLIGCKLIGQDVAHIAQSLRDLPNLVQFDFSGSSDLGGTASLWTMQLKHLQHLKILGLNDCTLIGQDVAHIAESLRDLPHLVQLDLSENEDLGGTGVVWSMHLKQLQHLEKLGLSNCSLVEEDIKHIAKSLPNLVDLDLSGNDDLASAAVWSLHLKQLQHLQKLNLSKCLLIGQNIKDVAKSLSDLPKLVELDLSGNDELGGSAALWVMHFKQLQYLQKLNLSNCSLIGQDVTHIAESLKEQPNVVELNLAENYPMAGTASLWSIHLKHLTHLEKLYLCTSSLTEEDRECISESMSDLSKDGLVIEYI